MTAPMQSQFIRVWAAVAVSIALAAVFLSSPATLLAGWSRAADLSVCRSEHTAARLDGRIYVVGGLGRLGPLASVEVYDPQTGAWRESAPLPMALHHAAAAALGGKLYVAGGFRGLYFGNIRREVWAFDPAAGRWERKADLPANRGAHTLTALGGMLYSAGGKGPGAEELWRYDPGTDRWTREKGAGPEKREHLGAAVIAGKLYAVGGRWGKKGNLGTLEAFEPEETRWMRLPPMPTPRSGIAVAALAGRLHVIGGEAIEPVGTFALHEAYNPATQSWSTLPPLPTARHGMASVTLGGAWYVIGGATGPGIRTLYTLTCSVDVFRP